MIEIRGGVLPTKGRAMHHTHGILKLRVFCGLPDAFKWHSKLFFENSLADFNEKGILSRIY